MYVLYIRGEDIDYNYVRTHGRIIFLGRNGTFFFSNVWRLVDVDDSQKKNVPLFNPTARKRIITKAKERDQAKGEYGPL